MALVANNASRLVMAIARGPKVHCFNLQAFIAQGKVRRLDISTPMGGIGAGSAMVPAMPLSQSQDGTNNPGGSSVPKNDKNTEDPVLPLLKVVSNN